MWSSVGRCLALLSLALARPSLTKPVEIKAVPSNYTVCSPCVDGPCGFGSIEDLFEGNRPEKRTFTHPPPDEVDEYITRKVTDTERAGNLIPHLGDVHSGINSAIFRPFRKRPTNVAVKGLHGCTSLVVISELGVYMTHFWEVPYFELMDGTKTGVGSVEFAVGIIQALRDDTNPNPNMRSLRSVVDETGAFHDTSNVEAWLIAPHYTNDPRQPWWPDEMDAIARTVREIIPWVRMWDDPKMYPRLMRDDPRLGQSSSGVALAQYDPAQHVYDLPDHHGYPVCRVQKAQWRLWSWTDLFRSVQPWDAYLHQRVDPQHRVEGRSPAVDDDEGDGCEDEVPFCPLPSMNDTGNRLDGDISGGSDETLAFVED